jgi:hypothetical protein
MSDIEDQLAQMIPDPMVQRWRLLRPLLPPPLRQWIEAAARAMLASRLPYPQLIQQLDRVLGRRNGPSSAAGLRPDDADILRYYVMLQIRAEGVAHGMHSESARNLALRAGQSPHAAAPNAASAARAAPALPIHAPPPSGPVPRPGWFGPEALRCVRGPGACVGEMPAGKGKAWQPANFRLSIP